jgi:hypothetical protein
MKNGPSTKHRGRGRRRTTDHGRLKVYEFRVIGYQWE